MTRRLKALALASMAICALTAVAAEGAQAEALFHVDSAPALLRGAAVVANEWQFPIYDVKCGTTKFEATRSAKTSTELTLTPTYSKCTALGGAATVDVNGCSYVFHAVETVEANANVITTKTDLECPAGKEIKITLSVLECVVTVIVQSGLPAVTFVNKGTTAETEKRDLLAEFAVPELVVEEHGVNCPELGIHHGEYVGTATIQAFKDLEGKEGAQTGIFVS